MNIKDSSTLIKRYKQILSASHMVYRLVNSTYNVQELALRLTRLLCQFIKANSSSVFILDPKKNKVILIAVFDNKINILHTNKKDLSTVTKEEIKVARGYSIFKKHLMALPLVADENIGAIFVKRRKNEAPFNDFDKEMLSVFVEQSVTAIRNLQLYEEQQGIVLGSIDLIGKLLKKNGSRSLISYNASSSFQIVKCICKKLNMGQDDINNLYYAFILRDTGAMDVPYNILSKRSQLTQDEFKVIKKQPARSAELIRHVKFLKPVLPIILYHHEKYDGSGYPFGLKKDQIPMGANIMSVLEAFDAMTKERAYKNRLTVNEAVDEIKRNSGTQFHPIVVNAFVALSRQKKFRKILSKN